MKPTKKANKYVRFEHAGVVAYGIWETQRVKALEGIGVLRNKVAA